MTTNLNHNYKRFYTEQIQSASKIATDGSETKSEENQTQPQLIVKPTNVSNCQTTDLIIVRRC
jgi:hypothetical protein